MQFKGEFIPMKDCEHGFLYSLRARNLKLGVYDEKCQGFFGLRSKFNEDYIHLEYHADKEDVGTARPTERLEPCPHQTSFDSSALFYWLKLKNYQHGVA